MHALGRTPVQSRPLAPVLGWMSKGDYYKSLEFLVLEHDGNFAGMRDMIGLEALRA